MSISGISPEILKEHSPEILEAARKAHKEAWDKKAEKTKDLDKIKSCAGDAAREAALQAGASPELADAYARHLNEHRSNRYDPTYDGYGR